MIHSSIAARVLTIFVCVLAAFVMSSCDDDGTGPVNGNGTPEPGWETVGPPATGRIAAIGVAAIDPQTVVGVDASGRVLKTTDGGATWTRRDLGVYVFYDLYFADADHGWAVGSDGKIAATTDGGESWAFQNSRMRDQFNDVFFVDENEGWVVSWEGTILHTVDGGTVWVAEPSGFDRGFGGVFFADAKNGWVVGGGVLTTSDGGEHWEVQSVELRMGFLKSVFFVDGQTGWVAGFETAEDPISEEPVGLPVVFATTNGGASWERKAIGLPELVESIEDMFFVDARTGWAVGPKISDTSNAVILATVDGGETWTPSVVEGQDNFLYGGRLSSVSFADERTGWAGGGGLYATTDGGETWTKKDLPMRNSPICTESPSSMPTRVGLRVTAA